MRRQERAGERPHAEQSQVIRVSECITSKQISLYLLWKTYGPPPPAGPFILSPFTFIYKKTMENVSRVLMPWSVNKHVRCKTRRYDWVSIKRFACTFFDSCKNNRLMQTAKAWNVVEKCFKLVRGGERCRINLRQMHKRLTQTDKVNK